MQAGRLDRTSFVPLYYQLQEVLKEQVTSMTAERSAVYRTAGALGVGGAVAATVNPLAALGMYGGAAAYNLLGSVNTTLAGDAFVAQLLSRLG